MPETYDSITAQFYDYLHQMATQAAEEAAQRAVAAERDADPYVRAGDSLQDAVDAGGYVYITRDYDPSADEFPIRIRDPVRVSGEDMFHDIGVEGKLVFDILGDGHQYGDPYVVENMRIGGKGVRVRAWPYGTFSNVVLASSDDGIAVEASEHGATFGTTFHNVQAWNCGGCGFRLETGAKPHMTQFLFCGATACGGHGAVLRGYATSWLGGVNQLNHGRGFDVRNSGGMNIAFAYIEGNGRREEYPVEVYARDADGLTVLMNYFNGIAPRTVWHDHGNTCRAVNAHGCDGLRVRDNTLRNYVDVFCETFGTDPLVFDGNHALDDTPLQ